VRGPHASRPGPQWPPRARRAPRRRRQAGAARGTGALLGAARGGGHARPRTGPLPRAGDLLASGPAAGMAGPGRLRPQPRPRSRRPAAGAGPGLAARRPVASAVAATPPSGPPRPPPVTGDEYQPLSTSGQGTPGEGRTVYQGRRTPDRVGYVAEGVVEVSCRVCPGLIDRVPASEAAQVALEHFAQLHYAMAPVEGEHYLTTPAALVCDACLTVVELPWWEHVSTPPTPVAGQDDRDSVWLLCGRDPARASRCAGRRPHLKIALICPNSVAVGGRVGATSENGPCGPPPTLTGVAGPAEWRACGRRRSLPRRGTRRSSAASREPTDYARVKRPGRRNR
jgi:hypothetical protein